MAVFRVFGVLAMLLVAFAPALAEEVRTRIGVVRGEVVAGEVGAGVVAFRGVPYAAPPIGDLRWRAPQPPAAWNGVRPSTRVADCMHHPDEGDPARPAGALSEDCLYLNVWRAGTASAPRPVLVWIHGGGYVTGGSSPAIYDGAAFARRGLVVVSINYRLGRFGFFAHPALTAANEGETGNFAYMDMIAALSFVRDNIAAFGGDPARVTIMGESAGGDAVAHLIASPRAEGLFHRAVILSGNGRDHVLGGLSMAEAEARGAAFGESLGVPAASPDAPAALRRIPAEAMIDGLNLAGLLGQRARFEETYAKGAIVDGRIVLASPSAVLDAGRGPRVPLLIGTTTDDIPVFLPPPNDPFSAFGPERAAAEAAYAATGVAPGLPTLMAIGADVSMHEPARFTADRFIRFGLRAWLYRFDYVAEHRGPAVAGAGHASELPFLFGTLDAVIGERVTDRDRAASALFASAIANFALNGDPNGPGVPRWPIHDPARRELMQFARDATAAMRADPLTARLDLVERRAERRPAVAVLGGWAVGPRFLPPPAHVSPAVRALLANTPTPDVAAAQRNAPRGPDDWRRRATAEAAAGDAALPALAERLGVKVTPDRIDGVTVYRVEPAKLSPEHAGHLFVYVHGGAFMKGGGVAGSVEAVLMAAAMGIRAVAIDYRMAPDHPAPAAMDDVVAVWSALAAEIEPKRMILGGTSAGANLTLVSILRLKELGRPLPGALFVGTPPVDFAKATDTRFINEGVDRHLVTWDGDPAKALALYRGAIAETDWRISPIYGDVAGFPPTYLIAGTRDMMLSDTALMHRHLRRAGVVADLHVYEGQSHGDYVILATTPEGVEHQRELKAFILRHLAP